ncbi:MAG: glycosyltransferase family 2 protein [Bacteroidetes bacterium]|nr:glycosyltransferase family 2 protein [Bacteroidota bacterium]HET6244719.1 glycosyltransferase family 2 protein [Bacteroidia bacterium]
MEPISVVIITYNEEKNIGRCLDSLKHITDDIVVVDSFSTDKTMALCKKAGVNFIQKPWKGYSLTKNYANSQAKHDWILSIDADEALTEELQISIEQVKKQLNSQSVYKFNRLMNYCGKWIYHSGWYPDTKIRLFNKKEVCWEGDIHETLTVPPHFTEILLKGDLLHYSYYTIQEHFKQAERFAHLAADVLHRKGKKSSWALIFAKTGFKFFRNFFLKKGFMDGLTGFTICRITAWETYQKYCRLKGLNESL